MMISTGVFHLKKKKCNIVNSKISIFNNYLFFKFINKYQKDILRFALPSSNVCDFIQICTQMYWFQELLVYGKCFVVCYS